MSDYLAVIAHPAPAAHTAAAQVTLALALLRRVQSCVGFAEPATDPNDRQRVKMTCLLEI